MGNTQSERCIVLGQDNSLHQFINEPTAGNNILHLVVRNNENSVGEMEVGGEVGNTNHKELTINIRYTASHKFNEIHVPNFR